MGFVLSPKAQAISPPPDGGYHGANTAEGQGALFHLTTGSQNTAVGAFSLASNAGGFQNTAVGAYALLSNTAYGNTGTGSTALFSNRPAATTQPMGLMHSRATPLAARIQPSDLERSFLIEPVAITPL